MISMGASTRSADAAGDSSAAAVRVSNDGRTVFVTNRGDDTVGVFAFDSASSADRARARRAGPGAHAARPGGVAGRGAHPGRGAGQRRRRRVRVRRGRPRPSTSCRARPVPDPGLPALRLIRVGPGRRLPLACCRPGPADDIYWQTARVRGRVCVSGRPACRRTCGCPQRAPRDAPAPRSGRRSRTPTSARCCRCPARRTYAPT